MKKRKVFLLCITLLVVIGLGVFVFSTYFEEVDPETYGALHVGVNKDEINIYIKDDSDEYIGYHMIHDEEKLNESKVASNYDVWKLDGASHYTRNKYGRFRENLELVTTGEWELAVREEGANDFFGGNAHGDEITNSIKALVDGNEINLNERESYEANELQITTTSDLYRDNTITEDAELVGYHFKEYTFNRDGLTLRQEVEYAKDLIIDTAYVGMLPMLREDGRTPVTDTYKINDELREYDVSFGEEELGESVKGEKVTIFGEESGVKASMELLEKQSDIPSEILVWNAPRYNKMYFVYASDGYQVEEGEVWGQTTQYKIQVDD